MFILPYMPYTCMNKTTNQTEQYDNRDVFEPTLQAYYIVDVLQANSDVHPAVGYVIADDLLAEVTEATS